ncbi:hypothetical protein Pmar_PMAR018981 [Perkinsus marinus ATCC 50983]|uniref:Uncharacterized protein n=1 Tax=Perkinsus marinus (strain ATCC 50983 / TXsc) TaxID=423536 RepID=C5KXZ7_PERM5|nr:hypothetical protein Pmar_PMAR018981 [Perkinsus marinus ATCC 50983]EER10604.1 hypothetical protein Pmar_PMAR018981 [Perkinsus marinus ATCC 50983]|eukprot:XP_002778809.1 hypothetical protein Pmar_PMAR018981 [Perkinsus marinus ATCC 50983]
MLSKQEVVPAIMEALEKCTDVLGKDKTRARVLSAALKYLVCNSADLALQCDVTILGDVLNTVGGDTICSANLDEVLKYC